MMAVADEIIPKTIVSKKIVIAVHSVYNVYVFRKSLNIAFKGGGESSSLRKRDKRVRQWGYWLRSSGRVYGGYVWKSPPSPSRRLVASSLSKGKSRLRDQRVSSISSFE